MKKLSFCGMECEKCPLYEATVKNDQDALRELAIACSTENKIFQMEDMCCLGCWTKENDFSKMCKDCEIRNCGKQQLVLNCGECVQYPCEIYEKHIPKDAPSRKNLSKM